MTETKELKNKIEKKFLKIRGWKNWEEYDGIAERLETEINARKELIDITIKLTIKDVLKLINEFEGREYTDFEIWEGMKKELKNKIRKLK